MSYDAVANTLGEALGEAVVTSLNLKGYCTIDNGWSREELTEVQAEAKLIDRYYTTPGLLVEGLLGPEGSGEIAELEAPTKDPEDLTDGETIRKFDSYMTTLAETIDPYLLETLDIECGERTIGLLHRPGSSFGDPPEVTERMAAKWLHIFRRHRLMVLVFLAPKGGSLRMRPFDNESEESLVNIKNGDVVILRADALSHVYVAGSEKDHVLSCWLLGPKRSGPRGAFADGRDGMPMVPVARDIVEWANERLTLMKATEATEAGSLRDQDIPREWKLLAAHSITKGAQVAVRGISVNLPTRCETMDTFLSPMLMGTDLGVEVPFLRWNHFEGNPWAGMYDPDPDCYKHSRVKTTIKHAAFIEGYYLFDNKFFNMSVLESKVTDPCQRLTLESAYEALHMNGFTKKSLSQAFIGVYQGHTASDWDKIEHDQAGGCAGSYSPTIASNRVSFSLGIMGPSFTIDVEGAASLAAVYQGCHDVIPTREYQKPLVKASLSGGVTLVLSSYWWPVHNQFMCSTGRCLSFDQSAGGYVKGEGVTNLCLRRTGDLVEGEIVIDQKEKNIGIISSYCMINSGQSSSLSAPSAPALQRMLADAARLAFISPLDVDAQETCGKADLMTDAIEATAVARSFRGLPGGSEEPLSITSLTTKLTYTQETCGIAALVASLLAQRIGTISPNVHLKALNPYVNIDPDDFAVNFANEATVHRCRSSFYGVNAHGLGGTNCQTITWSEIDDEKFGEVPMPPLDRQVFSFWPGGGGELEDAARPEKGYSILGSWSQYESIERMRAEGEGRFGFMVTLGENRFESFQIVLDGDSDRVLHPGVANAPKGGMVNGPTEWEECAGFRWTIDGRAKIAPQAIMDSLALDAKQTLPASPTGVVKTPDFGVPGDQYHVTLQLAGKWRTVTWEKVPTSVDAPLAPKGSYYIMSSWAGWSLDEMVATEVGVFKITVTIPGSSWDRGSKRQDFLIVRDKDLDQTFYPPNDAATFGKSVEVDGPDTNYDNMTWQFNAKVGEVFEIEFKRLIEGESETRSVQWRRVEMLTR